VETTPVSDTKFVIDTAPAAVIPYPKIAFLPSDGGGGAGPSTTLIPPPMAIPVPIVIGICYISYVDLLLLQI
jgi:hypothetical protein